MVMETVLVASTVVVEEKNINVWVEHARWWCQKSFNSWVLYVLALFQSLVVTMIRHSSMKRNPAVKTLVAMGFALGDVLLIADLLKDNGNQISADKKMWKSRRHQNQAVYITVPGGDSEKDVTRFQELLTTSKDQKKHVATTYLYG
ncbi:baculoviral IAP repeat-containing protein 7-B [Biomphalaria glabrata]|nr:baculoviral IAP repeat-containing protein 7-B-like [Biomphalaria glabrata]